MVYYYKIISKITKWLYVSAKQLGRRFNMQHINFSDSASFEIQDEVENFRLYVPNIMHELCKHYAYNYSSRLLHPCSSMCKTSINVLNIYKVWFTLSSSA